MVKDFVNGRAGVLDRSCPVVGRQVILVRRKRIFLLFILIVVRHLP